MPHELFQSRNFGLLILEYIVQLPGIRCDFRQLPDTLGVAGTPFEKYQSSRGSPKSGEALTPSPDKFLA
jgi:hypothetical protein